MVACLFAGCKKDSGKESENESEIEFSKAPIESLMNLATCGGYSFEGRVPGQIPERAKAAFDEAIDGLDGVSYQPLAWVLDQLVAGRNYWFIVLKSATTPNAKEELSLMCVYDALDAPAVILSESDFKLTEYITDEIDTTVKERFSAAVHVPEDGGLTMMPQELASATSKAFNDFKELDLRALACLGTQSVAGTNYALVCEGTKGENSDLFLVVLYCDLKGNASVKSVCPIEI